MDQDAAIAKYIRELRDYDVFGDEAGEKIIQIGEPAILPLIEAFRLESDEIEDVTYLVHITTILAKIGQSALQPLLIALNDPDRQVRAYVVETLGKMKNSQAVEPLIDKLSDIHPQVRANVARALGKIENKQAVEPLIAALQKDKEPWVCYSIMFVLGELGDKRALPALKEIQANATNVTYGDRTLANVANQIINAIISNTPPY